MTIHLKELFLALRTYHEEFEKNLELVIARMTALASGLGTERDICCRRAAVREGVLADWAKQEHRDPWDRFMEELRRMLDLEGKGGSSAGDAPMSGQPVQDMFVQPTGFEGTPTLLDRVDLADDSLFLLEELPMPILEKFARLDTLGSTKRLLAVVWTEFPVQAAGMDLPAPTETAATGSDAYGDHDYIFACEGGVWLIRFGKGRECRLPDLDGCRYLARLLGQPNHAIPVEELLTAKPVRSDVRDTAYNTVTAADAAANGIGPADGADPVMDAKYIQEVKDRRKRLQADLANAPEGSLEAKELEEQIRKIDEPVLASRGLGRKVRNMSNSATRMTQQIHQAIKRVRDQLTDKGLACLADHLEQAVHTEFGAFQYTPAPVLSWLTHA